MAIAIAGTKPIIDKRYARFRLRVASSRIHRWGVYADQAIPAGRKVIEYAGEKIDRAEFERRQDMTYLFRLDDEWLIDGSAGGSGAEFVNHSCEPNLATRILKGHILYFSRRSIGKGEELTIDYRYDDSGERMTCRCGSKRCRGTINVEG
ncbi:MAG TPA: SET domain-containing protein-lysine N-methyltransferase [Terriglobia bacterium]|nr:SET domain-containing protein-lysine N-methyltransferase [Terriglobia bacterium]